MRKNAVLMTVLMVALVFALMPVAMPAVGAEDVACDWTGTWDTCWGKMELVQTGNVKEGVYVFGTVDLTLPQRRNLTGSYRPDNELPSYIDGGLSSRNMLAGIWVKLANGSSPRDSGMILFIISEDCSSFEGKWRYGFLGDGAAMTFDSSNWDGDWTGSRVGPSKPPSKQSVCASAKPRIAGASEFKRAMFTIGGTEPQEVRITTPAENFAIVKEYGERVYQRIDGKSWGSLTLEPGTYILSCGGGGVMGLESATVCIEYSVVTGTPPAPTPETKTGISLPPREVVLATMPDGSKLMGLLPPLSNYAPGSVQLMPGQVVVEVGKIASYSMLSIFPDGHTEPAYFERAEPGYLADVVSAGTTPDGKWGITHISGTKAGRGWLTKEAGHKTKLRLVVTPATQPPTFKKGGVTIEGKVTYHGNPMLDEAKIMFNHESGKSFDDPDWKTKADGSFKIVTERLWAGEYRIRVFMQGTSFGKTMWSKKEEEPKITVLAGKLASFGPYDIEMETMREKLQKKYPGIAIPGGF